MIGKKMIGVEDIQKIVKLVLLTGFIKNIKPVSLMIVGNAGVGKTEIIKSFKTESAILINDLSMMGLIEMLEENKNINHVIIPDFLKITAKKKSTSDSLIHCLNNYTEEGINEIRFPGTKINLLGRQGGIITATTKASFDQNKKRWLSIGFVSRLIIISFGYNKETENKILNYIYSEKFIKQSEPEYLKYGKKKEIKSTVNLNKQLYEISKLNETSVFRRQKILQSLVKSNALLNKRDKVNLEDINEIKRLSQFFNLDYKKI